MQQSCRKLENSSFDDEMLYRPQQAQIDNINAVIILFLLLERDRAVLLLAVDRERESGKRLQLTHHAIAMSGSVVGHFKQGGVLLGREVREARSHQVSLQPYTRALQDARCPVLTASNARVTTELHQAIGIDSRFIYIKDLNLELLNLVNEHFIADSPLTAISAGSPGTLDGRKTPWTPLSRLSALYPLRIDRRGNLSLFLVHLLKYHSLLFTPPNTEDLKQELLAVVDISDL